MVTRILILALALMSIGSVNAQVSSDTKDIQVALKRLRVGTDTAKYWTALSHVISVASTHRQGTTAKAVYDYVQTIIPVLTAGTGISITGTYPNLTLSTTAVTTVQEDGTALTSRPAINFQGVAVTASDDSGNNRTNVAFDEDVNGIAALTPSNSGIVVHNGAGSFITRIVGPNSNGIAIGSGSGTGGNITVALAHDALAIENLDQNGMLTRTGTNTWAARTITAGPGISVANGDGISGQPTITNTGDTDASDDITTATTLGGDLTGTLPNPTVSGLQGRTVLSTAPSTGEVLKWNGSAWAPAADGGGGGGHVILDNGTPVGQRDSLNVLNSPSITWAIVDNGAGNVTELQAEVAADGITAVEIAANAVGASELASTAVTPGSYTNANVTFDADGRATAASSGTAGHILRDNGTDKTARAAANFVSTSTVTAALTDDAGSGETEIRMTVPTDGITATEIAANAVGSSELASTTVTPGTYTNATITVDADGRATAASSGTAPATGSGTTNFIPKWTSSSVLSNSIISENGTVLIGLSGADHVEIIPSSSEISLFDFGHIDARIKANVNALETNVGMRILGNSAITGNLNVSGTISTTSVFKAPGITSTSVLVPSPPAAGSFSAWAPSGEASYISFTESGSGLRGAFGCLPSSGDFVWTVGALALPVGTERMRLTNSGNLGIGIAATQKLDVNGNARLRAAVYDGLNSAGSSGNILTSTGSATQWATAASIIAAGAGLTTATSFSGDVTGVYNNLQLGTGVVGATELASTAVTPGTYGGATSSAVITVDADGRITSASNTTITDNNTNIGNTNLTVSGTRTLNFNNNTLEMQTGTGTLIVSTSSTSAIAQRWNIGQGARVAMYDAAGTTLINQDYFGSGAFYRESPNRSPWQKGLTTSGLIAADYISKEANFYVHKDGYVVFPDVTVLSGTGSNKMSWGATNTRYEYLVSGVKKSLSNIEDDFIGVSPTVHTANYTAGTTNEIYGIIDCNAGAVTVTLDATMREGITYRFKCRRNATNAVTFNAGGAITFDIDESSSLTPTTLVTGAGGTGISANYKVITATRYANNVVIK